MKLLVCRKKVFVQLLLMEVAVDWAKIKIPNPILKLKVVKMPFCARFLLASSLVKIETFGCYIRRQVQVHVLCRKSEFLGLSWICYWHKSLNSLLALKVWSSKRKQIVRFLVFSAFLTPVLMHFLFLYFRFFITYFPFLIKNLVFSPHRRRLLNRTEYREHKVSVYRVMVAWMGVRR